MKFTIALLILAGTAMTSAASLTSLDTELCATQGGVYNNTELPEGASYHRKCAGHPLGEHSTGETLEKRACARRQYGCQDGYCWKKCSERDGPWCWQAWEYGVGNWVTCSNDGNCAPANLARADCGICNDSSCGCSC